MNRKEHIEWCKERALEYLDRNSEYYDLFNAKTSMLADLRKHDETKDMVEIAFKMSMFATTHDEVERFIEGFN